MKTRGVFTISIDLELAWGDCDIPVQPAIRDKIGLEREIVKRILALCSTYDVRATWAVVGHLLLDHCTWKGGVAHPEITRPVLRNQTRDWFFQHPPDENDGLWYGRDIVAWIRATSPPQEIGSHSFCHLPYDERTACVEAVRADVQTAKHLHEAWALPFQAFVFPRNAVGYRDLLADAGIRVYRGRLYRWYDGVPLLRRLFNLLYFALRVPPPTVRPIFDANGLVNIPGSMVLVGRAGVRKLVPPGNLTRMAGEGLRRAVARGEVFHLWFHPSNFAYETDEQFRVLEAIFQAASQLREQGVVEVLTMGDVERRALGSPTGNDQIALDTRARAIAHHDAAADEFVDKYRRMSKDYFSSPFAYGRKKVEEVLDDTLRGLVRGSTVLDIGCGTGEHVRMCRERGFDVVGIEPAPKLRAVAQASNPGVPVLDGVITSLPFGCQTFDLVLAVEVLRYLHRADVRQAYREMVRVLRPGGRLFFTMVNRYGSNGFYIYDGARRVSARLLRRRAPVHCEFVTPEGVRADLEEIGLEQIAFYGRVSLPIQLAYEVSAGAGGLAARLAEPLDDWLSRRRAMTGLANHLIVTAIRAAGATSIASPIGATAS